MKMREGDFIETIEGLIFDVKGLIHPPDRVIAYLRYLEDENGNRIRNGKRYRKIYSLTERDNIIKIRYPQYMYYDKVFGEWLEEVPRDKIIKHYKPEEKVQELNRKGELNEIEKIALKLIQILHESTGTPLSKLGISGSILIDLYTLESDIDIIVYGRRNCITVYEKLKNLMMNEEENFSSYKLEDLEKLYEFRSKDTYIKFEDFYKIEKRKVSQGKFMGKDFFIRFILDWDEVKEEYGDKTYINLGRMRIKAIVEDDEYSIFTPCKYIISKVEILDGNRNLTPPIEIVSFRGRFCEQARKGEEVVAEGKIEKVVSKRGEEYHRLLIGNKPSDFMITKINDY